MVQVASEARLLWFPGGQIDIWLKRGVGGELPFFFLWELFQERRVCVS